MRARMRGNKSMTSANVIYYTIRKNGKKVAEIRHNILCDMTPIFNKIKDFEPDSDFTIQASGFDCEEAEWEHAEIDLTEWKKRYSYFHHPS